MGFFDAFSKAPDAAALQAVVGLIPEASRQKTRLAVKRLLLEVKKV